MNELLSVPDAAARVGCSRSLISKRCKDGTIPAIRIGAEYRIKASDLDAWVKHTPTSAPAIEVVVGRPIVDTLFLIDEWLSHLSHVKALSPRTLNLYRVILNTYLRRMAQAEQPPLALGNLFERKTILAVFSKLPPKSFSTKNNTHIALMSFAKYLIEEGMLDRSALDTIKALKPRRQVEPRRTHLKPSNLHRLFDVVLTRDHAPIDNLTVAAAFACMGSPGRGVRRPSVWG